MTTPHSACLHGFGGDSLEGIAPSVGTVGDAYDNALMESVIGLYKTECIRPGPFHDQPLKTIADIEYATMAWVDWYNNRRLHSTLGMIPPTEFEHAHYAASRSRCSPFETGTAPVTVQNMASRAWLPDTGPAS
jgi:transposase InsO family protein